MALKLYDSLSREQREIRPAQPDGVLRFYNCGPTVYAPAHIGNFRTFVINDVLRRVLELQFPGKVKHVRNLTDVDDRTITQARAEQRPLGEITAKWTKLFHGDCRALNCLPPHVEPTATGHIPEQVSMIDVLMEKGNAYRAADGSVYFKIQSDPAYGALSRIKERELKVTNSVFDADHKDDVGDFALWKAHKPEEDGDVQWPGPRDAAAGRPGWHIECSAMIKKHLGETIDLHTGGVDLLFPHHENEIAQSECCNGVTFSRHWYHCEHLLVEGTSMSKSRGNYFTLGDLLGKGHSALAVRYALLNGHPRKQLNFVAESLHSASVALDRLQHFDQQIRIRAVIPDGEESLFNGNWGIFKPAYESLLDDLNIPEALGHVFTAIKTPILSFQEPFATKTTAAAFRQICTVLGIEFWKFAKPAAGIPIDIQGLADRRWAAKQAKDFAGADRLRAELTAAGWSMRDAKDGFTLEPLKKA
jgi:cysteinyl-tRNA synthetase